MSRKILSVFLVIGVVLAVGAWYIGRSRSVSIIGESPTTSSTATESMTAPRFVTQAETRSSKEKYCTFTISYPQAQIVGNPGLEQWLNNYLKTQFVPSESQLADCENSIKQAVEQPVTQMTTVSYSVKLSTAGLASFTYVASSYFPGAAHPENIIEAFTIDLAARRVVTWNELLQPNTQDDFNDLLYAAVAEAFTAEGQEPYFDQKTFLADYTKDSYDFYITSDSLVIVNLFDVHAIQGIEAKVPLYKLKPLIDPHGVLMQLVSQDV